MGGSTDPGNLTGRVILITGAGGSLGWAIARSCKSEGAALVLTDISQAVIQKAHPELAHQPDVLVEQLDVARAQDWTRLIDLVHATFGRLDGLVNNAGRALRKSLVETSDREWSELVDVNLRGPFLGIRASASLLGRSKHSAIINIGSTSAVTGSPAGAYAATKWGLRGLTKHAAMDLADQGVRVNCVHPGAMPSAMTPADGPFAQSVAIGTPTGRLTTPADVAATVAFLLSDSARQITAADIVIDGGFTELGAFWSTRSVV